MLPKNAGRPKKVQVLDHSFKIMIFTKLAFAIGETLSGILLLVFKHQTIQNLIFILTSGQLKANPKAFIASHLVQLGTVITLSGQRMAALYLLLHGILKLLTLILLLRKKLWAYPLSILLFLGFIVYQMRDFFLTHHFSMIALTLFDLLIIILTWLEYKELKKRWTI
ncbi:DUF2127 domain-containing protein [Streptococcus catagoni]|uniref:DUF2127 domain-containing protein n=1 Tax=Streptococcus catagoni TaxID=2654874 RepID=UPI00140C7988|nr:DUF2127 domain-containing protein [Streptococcus catagoni]